MRGSRAQDLNKKEEEEGDDMEDIPGKPRKKKVVVLLRYCTCYTNPQIPVQELVVQVLKQPVVLFWNSGSVVYCDAILVLSGFGYCHGASSLRG